MLSDAVQTVARETIEIVGASRTDSGAHAKGQVCHFDTVRPIRPAKWKRAINDLLPRDLAVVGAQWVNKAFHSRFWASDRWYRYRILNGKPDPHRSRYTYHYSQALDHAAMHEAAQLLVGTRDFFAFTQLIEKGTNTVRTVRSIRVREIHDEVWIDVVATAYARGMMRRISGALWEIGRGARNPDSLLALLAQREKDKVHWPTVLPASGLCLMKVNYGRSPREQVRHDP